MKIAIVCGTPGTFLVDKMLWVADGFRDTGHDVVLCHDLAAVKAADQTCDCVLLDQHGAGMNPNSLAEMSIDRKSIWMQWWRDLLAMDSSRSLVDQEAFKQFSRLFKSLDYLLVKERSLLSDYQAMGMNAAWFDQACPADMPACLHTDKPEWDVLVVGSAGHQQRREDARTLAQAGFRVAFVGMPGGDTVPPGCHWLPWHHPTRELPKLVSRCAVVLGVDYRTDLPGFTSDRSYLVAGMGACYVARCADYGTNSVSHSPAAQLAAWIYDDAGSLLDVMRQAMADPDERRKRGAASRELVMARHTYRNRAAELCQLIGIEQGRRLVEAAGVVT